MAPKLLKRYAQSERWLLDNGLYQLKVGGDISNCRPFEIEGDYTPIELLASNADEIQTDVWRYRGANVGYTADMQNGVVRIHPVRGNWNKYIEIGAVNPIQLSINQLSNKRVELFKDTAQVRYGLFLSDVGFKLNYVLKPGYSGDGSFDLTFDVVGLTQVGRMIYNDGELVGTLPSPFMYDSADPVEERSLSKSISNGILTLSGDLSNLTFPVIYDPVFTPTDAQARAYRGSNGSPNNVFTIGGAMRRSTGGANIETSFLSFEMSSIPSGSTITDASVTLYVKSSSGNACASHSYYMSRLLRDFGDTDGNNVAADAGETTWNSSKHGTQTWTSGGGLDDGNDHTSTDEISKAGLSSPVDGTSWAFPSAHAIAQTCLDNTVDGRTKLFSTVLHVDTEGANPVNRQIFYTPLETEAYRPDMSITYSTPGGNLGSGLGSLRRRTL